MNQNPLKQLEALGQSIWLDFIKRDLISSGELKKLINKDCLRGMTSNPTIFDQAINESHEYDSPIHKMAQEGKTLHEIYETLTLHDVQDAADEFHETYEKLNGRDGYVSLEVNPHLAYDTEATIREARRLWQELNRPNVLIKVPATKQGLPAIKQLISEGINVNVTILFGLSRYREVTDAFISGLEARAKKGEPLHHVTSVASFFLSRIDVLVDPILEKVIQQNNEKSQIAKKIHGQVAIASAKLAYQDYENIFNTARFKRLTNFGARAQRLLWASTSTKNPSYSKIKYVEALIAPQTVNTLPYETFVEYRKQGQPIIRINADLDMAHWIFKNLSKVGIDIKKVTDQLEKEGVEKFNKAYDDLLQTLEKKSSKFQKAA
jgi:transaldolase